LLKEILDLLELIIRKTPKTKTEFLANEDVRDATALRIQAVGEHVRSLSEKFREDHPELPWHQAIAMRNIIAHEYGNIDYEIVFEVITGGDMDKFKTQVQDILKV